MTWQQLKQHIYCWEGGWLDIYVHGTTSNYWKQWASYVNDHFRIEWYNGKTQRDEAKIDFSVVQAFWEGNDDLGSTARVFVDNIQVNAHFFDEEEIENDIDPREFTNMEDHEKLINYLKGLSQLLNKEVTVTPENCPEIILIRVQGDSVEINLDEFPGEWPFRIKE